MIADTMPERQPFFQSIARRRFAGLARKTRKLVLIAPGMKPLTDETAQPLIRPGRVFTNKWSGDADELFGSGQGSAAGEGGPDPFAEVRVGGAAERAALSMIFLQRCSHAHG